MNAGTNNAIHRQAAAVSAKWGELQRGKLLGKGAQKIVSDVVSAVDTHGKNIEKQKLKAVGLRLRMSQADGHEEARVKAEHELRQRIKEKL